MAGPGASLFRLLFGRSLERFGGIPGPTPTFPFGNALLFRGRRPWDVCAEFGEEYGEVSVFWLGWKPVLVLNGPSSIEAVLETQFDDFYKDDPCKALRPTLRNSIFVHNPPEWDRLRKAHPCETPTFHQWLPKQAPVMRAAVRPRVQGYLDAARPLDVLDAMQRLCFFMFNRCAIGEELDDAAFHQFYVTSITATRRMQLPKFLLFPPMKPSFHRAMREHYGTFERFARDARQTLDAGDDLLRVMLRDGVDVDDVQLGTLVANIQAGGNFSCAAALVNTYYLLNHHPMVGQKLHAELRSFLAEEPEYDVAALERCRYLDSVLRESLRFIAPVPVYFRNTKRDRTVRLDGRELPPDTMVCVTTQAVQRSGERWEDPDEFRPERWDPETVAANPQGSDYFFPFGRGPRVCPGADLAMLGMKVVLAELLGRAAVEIDTKAPYRQEFHCGVAEPVGFQARVVAHRPVGQAAPAPTAR
jgi:cytochrome P450